MRQGSRSLRFSLGLDSALQDVKINPACSFPNPIILNIAGHKVLSGSALGGKLEASIGTILTDSCNSPSLAKVGVMLTHNSSWKLVSVFFEFNR